MNEDPFNDWKGWGCNDFVPVLGGNGTKIAATGDILDQPPGQTRRVRGKLADHVADHLVSSPKGAILVTSPGTNSLYPHPPQSLNPPEQRALRSGRHQSFSIYAKRRNRYEKKGDDKRVRRCTCYIMPLRYCKRKGETYETMSLLLYNLIP